MAKSSPMINNLSHSGRVGGDRTNHSFLLELEIFDFLSYTLTVDCNLVSYNLDLQVSLCKGDLEGFSLDLFDWSLD